MKVGIARGPAGVDAQVRAFVPAESFQTLKETSHSDRSLRIISG